MSQDWDIKPCSGVCASCSRTFEDKEAYISMLAYIEHEGYRRSDYCMECRPVQEDGGASDSHGVWQGVFRAPPPPEEEAVTKETAETLLRRFIEEDDESKANVIYVLAIMLERKKLFVEKSRDSRKDGKRILIFEHRKTGESFIVPDPDLKLGQLEDVQTEVTLLLGGKVPGKDNVD